MNDKLRFVVDRAMRDMLRSTDPRSWVMQTITSPISHNWPFNTYVDPDNEDVIFVEIALAGFQSSDINIETKEGSLCVAWKREEEKTIPEQYYFHRGISLRNGELKFVLEPHHVVDNATYVDGLLRIEIVKVLPEQLKPRTIDIDDSGAKSLARRAAKSVSKASKAA